MSNEKGFDCLSYHHKEDKYLNNALGVKHRYASYVKGIANSKPDKADINDILDRLMVIKELGFITLEEYESCHKFIIIKSSDKAGDYYNLTHPHRHAGENNFKHRLGRFKAMGKGVRQYSHNKIPSLGILHLPVYDVQFKGVDYTAEHMAKYLADPVDERTASIHAFSDRDSFIICQPFDSQASGAANSRANAASIQFEIAGTGRETDAYWSTADAIKKYKQTALAICMGSALSFGDGWKWTIPPLQEALLDSKGAVIRPGWTQHREVPYYGRKKDKHNQVPGQHKDLAENFPYKVFFRVLRQTAGLMHTLMPADHLLPY